MIHTAKPSNTTNITTIAETINHSTDTLSVYLVKMGHPRTLFHLF